jgi:septal ring factor EnvC (AmiA/AmiB activator)
MAETDSFPKWLAALASALFLAAASGATYVAFSSFGDISSLKSTVDAIGDRVNVTERRFDELTERLNQQNAKQADTLSRMLAAEGRCDEVQGRINHIERRFDSYLDQKLIERHLGKGNHE